MRILLELAAEATGFLVQGAWRLSRQFSVVDSGSLPSGLRH
ncbi:MAG TPA: hypothetical protein VF660_07675 [Actinomycetota bacterium]